MYNTIEFDVKETRVKIRQPKRRIYMAIRRSDVFQDRREKRERTRQAQLAKAIKEME
jgi:hypothetical protein